MYHFSLLLIIQRANGTGSITYTLHQHIPDVMDSVDEKNRCQCGPEMVVKGKEYPRKAEKAD